MKSLKAMGKTKNKNILGPAEEPKTSDATSPTKPIQRAQMVKMAKQDRLIDYIKTANTEGLQAMLADGSSDKDCINKFHTKSGMHPLAVAADESNLEAVELLIKAGANVDIVDKNGKSALLYAASQLYEAIIDVLVQAGADVTATNTLTGETAAHIAAKHKFNSIVTALDFKGVPMDTKDNRQETPLSIGLKLENFPLCDFLLTRDADINTTSAFGDTPLLRSAFDGRMAAANYILDHGGAINHRNQNGETALLIASRHGNLPMIEALIRRGANINEGDNTGKTPLIVATMAGKLAAVKLLLAQETIDVCLADNWGFCALACACMSDPVDLTLLHALLRAPGIAVNQQDRAFNTPLVHAARHIAGDDIRALLMLLECGADPSLTNIDGKIAEEIVPAGPAKKAFEEEMQRRGKSNQPRLQGDKPHWVLELQRNRHYLR